MQNQSTDRVQQAWKEMLAFLESSSDATLQLEQAFDDAHSSSNGVLNILELANLLISAGLSLTVVDIIALRNDLDINKDGFISYAEFVSRVQKNKDAVTSASLPIEPCGETQPPRPRSGHILRVWASVIELLTSKSEIAVQIEDAFKEADANGSSFLKIKALCTILLTMGAFISPDMDTLQADLDRNNNGEITLNEFLDSVMENKSILEQAAAVSTDGPALGHSF